MMYLPRFPLLALLAVWLCTAAAAATPTPDAKAPAAKAQAPGAQPAKPPEVATPIPDPPQVNAKAHILMDFASGKVIAAHNADERLEPASVTKIMAAYVVFREIAAGHLALTDMVTVSKKAWQTGGSKTFIEVGKQVSVEDLLHGLIVQSGNDASVALAEHIAGSEATFAEMMNTQAKRLGMINSHFTNAPGLPDPNHYTTARDLALVTAATIREFPDYYKWYSLKEFTFNNINQKNRNKLLWEDATVDGVKTGHTEAAGYCLVASSVRDGQRMISVVMGAPSVAARTQGSQALLTYGTRFFETHKLYSAEQVVETLRIWMGDTTELPVGPAQDLTVTIPRGRYERLSAQLEKNQDITAPVAKGDVVGKIRVSMDGQDLVVVPLVALKAVGEGGLWRWAQDSLLQWIW